MFRNHLKIAIRNFLKFKGYSLINVLGLAVGIACSLLIMLYVQDELSYDRFHEKADNIYRVVTTETSEGKVRRLANTFGPLAPALLTEFPVLEHAVRFFPKSVVVKYGDDKIFQEDNFFFCDSTVFSVFSFELVRGNPETALDAPNSVVLTEETAHRYFGNENPLGEVLRIEREHDFIVTGILKNVPANSHFSFDFLASISSIRGMMGDWVFTGDRGSWFWPPMYTYVELASGSVPEQLESRFPELIRKYMGDWAVEQRAFHLQPLTDIHLRSDLENEIAPTGDITYVYVFSLVAFLILIIACINFMKLATARSANRAREVGLRKVVGAARHQLIRQFLGESVFYAVLAMLLAIALLEFVMPEFNQLAGKQLNIDYSGNLFLWLGLLGLTLFVGVVAGSYPALF